MDEHVLGIFQADGIDYDLWIHLDPNSSSICDPVWETMVAPFLFYLRPTVIEK